MVGVVVHTFNPSILEGKAGRFLILRAGWSTSQVPGQSGLRRETLSQENKTNKSIVLVMVVTCLLKFLVVPCNADSGAVLLKQTAYDVLLKQNS